MSQISSMLKYQAIDEEDDTSNDCSVCMEPVRVRGKIACDHIFCFDCISQWAASQLHHTCPECRVPFTVVKKVKKNAIFADVGSPRDSSGSSGRDSASTICLDRSSSDDSGSSSEEEEDLETRLQKARVNRAKLVTLDPNSVRDIRSV